MNLVDSDPDTKGQGATLRFTALPWCGTWGPINPCLLAVTLDYSRSI